MVEQAELTGNPEGIFVNFNTPFIVKPKDDYSRFSMIGVAGENRNKGLFIVPLKGEGGSKGLLSINGVLAPGQLRDKESVICPAGVPEYDIHFDENTGLSVVRKLPITVSLFYGPFLHSQVSSGEVGVSLNCDGNDYQANVSSFPFKGDLNPVYMNTTNTWKDMASGRVGPMYFPSETNFSRIRFTIIKSS